MKILKINNERFLVHPPHRMIHQRHHFFHYQILIKLDIFMINHVQLFFKHYLVVQTSIYLFVLFNSLIKLMFRLFELVIRHLDLDSLLEFFEQIRLLTETPLSKRTSDLSPSPPQNLFPMHVVIERIGDMTLGN